MLRAAAKEWREENKIVATGATRYDFALEEAADAIEELSKDRDNWKATAKEEREGYWYWFDKYQKDIPIIAHWYWDKDGMDQGLGAWKCSNCHRKPETWWEAEKNHNPYRCAGSHYCGNCGAKMEKENDNGN